MHYFPSNPKLNDDHGDEFLTRADAARFLSTTSAHLAQLASANKGPAYHKPNGGKVLYRKRDLVAYIESGRVPTEDQA